MSGAERREYYRRTALRGLAAFAFWFMGVMLAAFMVTGAMFSPMGPKAMLVSLVIGISGGLALAARIIQMARHTINTSVEREPLRQPRTGTSA